MKTIWSTTACTGGIQMGSFTWYDEFSLRIMTKPLFYDHSIRRPPSFPGHRIYKKNVYHCEPLHLVFFRMVTNILCPEYPSIATENSIVWNLRCRIVILKLLNDTKLKMPTQQNAYFNQQYALSVFILMLLFMWHIYVTLINEYTLFIVTWYIQPMDSLNKYTGLIQPKRAIFIKAVCLHKPKLVNQYSVKKMRTSDRKVFVLHYWYCSVNHKENVFWLNETLSTTETYKRVQ